MRHSVTGVFYIDECNAKCFVTFTLCEGLFAESHGGVDRLIEKYNHLTDVRKRAMQKLRNN